MRRTRLVRLICFQSQMFPQEPLPVSASPSSGFNVILAAGADAAMIVVLIQMHSATGEQ